MNLQQNLNRMFRGDCDLVKQTHVLTVASTTHAYYWTPTQASGDASYTAILKKTCSRLGVPTNQSNLEKNAAGWAIHSVWEALVGKKC